GLMGAIVWDLITWFYGLPTSSSHALIGGFAGAAVAQAGFNAVIFSGFSKIATFIFLFPGFGFFLCVAFIVVVLNLFWQAAPGRVDHYFRRLQLVSSALYSLGHGTNDAQKTMGIIALLLFNAGYLGPTFYVPYWVILICHAAISLGTLSGGWRIVHTMG